MSKHSQTTIEINGKRYDAHTGKLLKATSDTPVVKRFSDVAVRQPASHHKVHKSPEKSHTLMRHAVKKPAARKPNTASSVSEPATTSKHREMPVANFHHYDAIREERALAIKRSQLVSKFSDVMSTPSGNASRYPSHQPVSKRVQPLAVKAAPVMQQAAPLLPVLSRSESVLVKGLQSANSHTQPVLKNRKKHKKARLVSLSAGSLAALLLAGFVFYQNAPNLAVRYAAARSGVQAHLPNYRPAGFALSKEIEYTSGQVTVNFDSNSDDRNFTITQRVSDWNSDDLMTNYVASAGKQIQTYEDSGRTIYLYGEANATWVNNGVWYDIKGDSKLNSDQLIRIATSM